MNTSFFCPRACEYNSFHPPSTHAPFSANNHPLSIASELDSDIGSADICRLFLFPSSITRDSIPHYVLRITPTASRLGHRLCQYCHVLLSFFFCARLNRASYSMFIVRHVMPPVRYSIFRSTLESCFSSTTERLIGKNNDFNLKRRFLL